MAREDLVLKRVKKILDDNRVFFVRCNPQNGIGIPDIIACMDGFVGIEIKDDKNGSYGLTEAQKARGRAIVGNGGKFFIIDKNNVDEFEQMVVDYAADRDAEKNS